MNASFAWFLGIVLTLIVSIGWFGRGIIHTLMQKAAANAQDYAIVYAKGTALILVSMGTSFIQVFEKVSPDEASVYSWWMWVCKHFVVLVAGLNTFVAFVDRSVDRAREKKEERENPTPK